jgi:hypothetical protein
MEPEQFPATDAANDPPTERIISVRKLAAIDLALHGRGLILLEFGGATLVGLAVGLFVLWHAATQPGGPAIGSIVFGVYMFSLGCNYIPLLVYAIGFARRGDAASAAPYELLHREIIARRYGPQQALLLVPFAILALALWQAARARQTR